MAKSASLKIGGWNFRKLLRRSPRKCHAPALQAIWDSALLTTDGTEGVTAAFRQAGLLAVAEQNRQKLNPQARSL
jgi:hypothetical protein